MIFRVGVVSTIADLDSNASRGNAPPRRSPASRSTPITHGIARIPPILEDEPQTDTGLGTPTIPDRYCFQVWLTPHRTLVQESPAAAEAAGFRTSPILNDFGATSAGPLAGPWRRRPVAVQRTAAGRLLSLRHCVPRSDGPR